MSMFRKVSQWLTDKGDQFVRGGGPQNQGESANDSNQEFADAYANADESRRQMMDPFNDGDQKYGGRQPYRSRAELEAEAAQQARMQAQQEAEAYQAQMQAQYQAQQEQMQQTGTYPQMQAQYQAQQEQMQQTGTYPQAQIQAQYQAQQEQAAAHQAQQYQQPPQYQQQPQQGYQQQLQPMPGSNVLTFPGMQTTPDGMVYAHVEYIVQLCSRNECRKVIDYIRTNASVFLNMETIADASERQRCVDMLSGAAYALGCSLNKISPRGVYLISSPSVRVVMDNATQKLASGQEIRGMVRQSYGQDGAAAQPQYAAQPQQAPMAEEVEETIQNGGFSSGSPTQRFQSQGAQGMSVSFGTAMAGSYTGMHRAINAQRYNAQ